MVRRNKADGNFCSAGPLYCSTIVQPAQKIAETCADLLPAKDRSSFPALVCPPVRYAPGGTSYFFLPEDSETLQRDYEVLKPDWFPVSDGLYLSRRASWEDRTPKHMEDSALLWERLVEEAF